ncbi:mechanosensitive ion channel [Candidatus Pacearchaeota archaeon]|nr:mechanosensitive ion channel [Candidatus Pacearchaeota archaeon]
MDFDNFLEVAAVDNQTAVSWTGMYHKSVDYLYLHSWELLVAVGVLIVGFFVIRILSNIIGRIFRRWKYDQTATTFLQRTLSIFLWIILLIVVLSNLGINVTGFIAGLGAAGFIIGFATRDIFSNIAAGLLLLIYKPFRRGDEVEVAGIRGIVQEINMSLCILVAEKETYIAVPNSRIWGGPIKNFTRLKVKK